MDVSYRTIIKTEETGRIPIVHKPVALHSEEWHVLFSVEDNELKEASTVVHPASKELELYILSPENSEIDRFYIYEVNNHRRAHLGNSRFP